MKNFIYNNLVNEMKHDYEKWHKKKQSSDPKLFRDHAAKMNVLRFMFILAVTSVYQIIYLASLSNLKLFEKYTLTQILINPLTLVAFLMVALEAIAVLQLWYFIQYTESDKHVTMIQEVNNKLNPPTTLLGASDDKSI